MSLDKIIVSISGIVGILFTYWFFFGKKEEEKVVEKEVTITVDGGYSPSHIVVKKDNATTLHFIRRDSNSCLEEVVIPEFKIKKYLPLNTSVDIVITPKKKGEFPFSCGMHMYFGKISVI